MSNSLARRRCWTGRFAAVVISVLGAASGVFAAASPAPADNWAPVNSTDFPDPFVLYVPAAGGHPATYYGFATQNTTPSGTTINIQEATSSDGTHWAVTGTDALPTLGSWAKPGETWAPTVASYTDQSNALVYVMYYTATEIASPGVQCIGAATSSTPLGPYHDSNASPVVCQDDHVVEAADNGNYGGSIDPQIFMDPNGTPWLLWKNDGNAIGMSTVIWSMQLDSTLRPTGPMPISLLQNNSSSWQGSIVEGPDMVFEPATGGGGAPTGTYDLFYSGGVYGSSTYAIGWATCPPPSSWTTSGLQCQDSPTDNPILTSAPGMSGPGGPSIYTVAGTGKQVMAFAAWEGSTIGYLSCGVRPMYLATLSLNANGTPAVLSPAVPAASPAVGPTCPQPPAPPAGYWQVASDGGVFTFGHAQFYGSTGSLHLNRPVVGMAATPDGRGYWLVASDGGIFAYGDAGFYGSTGSLVLNRPIIGMIPSLDGRGYSLIASDGGVFAFGDARFYGSAANYGLSSPITGAAPSFLGGGYWMVDSNGQIYSFGDARYEGAPPFAPGGYRITGMAGSHSSNGYWLVSANGNVADYGDAAPYGSAYGLPLAAPVVGMSATHDGAGYWLQGGDGGIFAYGDAPFFGSMGGRALNAPMVGIAAT